MAETPGGRTTRSRRSATPIPALAVGTNTGYGAAGKAVLRTQVASELTSLTSMMQNRAEPASKTPSRRGAKPASSRTRRQTSQAATIEEEIEETGGVEEEVGGELAEPAIPATMTGAPAPPPSAPAGGASDATEMARDNTRIPPLADEYDQPHQRNEPIPPPRQPSWLEVTLATIPQYLPRVLLDFGQDAWSTTMAILFLLGVGIAGLAALASLVGITYATVSLVPLPRFVAPYAEHFFVEMNRRAGVYPYSLPPHQLEQQWLAFRSKSLNLEENPALNDSQWEINAIYGMQIRDLNRRLKVVEEEVGIHDVTLTTLESYVPYQIVLTKNDRGGWDIPDRFWHAIQQRMAAPDGKAPLWDGFLKANEQAMETMFSKFYDTEIQGSIKQQHVISADQFKEALRDNYDHIEKHFKEQLREAESDVLSKMRRVAKDAAKEAIEESPLHKMARIQTSAIAQVNILRNSEEALRTVNYFSPGLGARVNPKKTSSTYEPPNTSTWFARLLGYVHPIQNVPIAALQRWYEAGDCWCAAPSTDKGKAQIEVLMRDAIWPDKLWVEHIERTGTTQIAAAPQDIEVWIPAESKKKAREAQAKLDELVSLRGSEPCKGSPPTQKHVCILQGTYDIHHDNWVQSFGTTEGMRHLGMATNSAIVRVTSNWGADYTCLYRLRMTGSPVDT